MDYEVLHTEDMPLIDLSENPKLPPDQAIRAVDEELGVEKLHTKIWYFEPGEEIQYHAHAEQEEMFLILEGEFSLRLGRAGEEEFVEVGPGTFYAAKPGIGHGHRYIGDDRGAVLAIAAPPTRDPGLDPHQL